MGIIIFCHICYSYGPPESSTRGSMMDRYEPSALSMDSKVHISAAMVDNGFTRALPTETR